MDLIVIVCNVNRMFEENLIDKISEAEREMEDIIEVLPTMFTSTEGIVERDLIIVKDVKKYITDLIEERGLNSENALIRVCMDGGGGFFKVN